MKNLNHVSYWSLLIFPYSEHLKKAIIGIMTMMSAMKSINIRCLISECSFFYNLNTELFGEFLDTIILPGKGDHLSLSSQLQAICSDPFA